MTQKGSTGFKLGPTGYRKTKYGRICAVQNPLKSLCSKFTNVGPNFIQDSVILMQLVTYNNKQQNNNNKYNNIQHVFDFLLTTAQTDLAQMDIWQQSYILSQ